jgi:hypothetical protein
LVFSGRCGRLGREPWSDAWKFPIACSLRANSLVDRHVHRRSKTAGTLADLPAIHQFSPLAKCL